MLLQTVNIIVDGNDGKGYLFNMGTPFSNSRKIVKVEESRRLGINLIKDAGVDCSAYKRCYSSTSQSFDHSIDAMRYAVNYQQNANVTYFGTSGNDMFTDEVIESIKKSSSKDMKEFRSLWLGDWILPED